MKSILLTTTAIVAFAGAAAADGHSGISFVGDAALGYNDDVEDGFYWDTNLDVTMTAALDNGVTATATFGLQIVDDALGGGDTDDDNGEATDTDTFASEDFVLEIATDSASLSFGDVDPVAEANYDGVDGDSTKGFFDQDAHFDVVGFDAMLVGEVTVAGVDAKISYGVLADEEEGGLLGDVEVIDALQLYFSGEFGVVSFEAAYQQGFSEVGGATEFRTEDDVFGVSATAAVAGAELTLAYIDDTEENSIGLGASYPVGPVTLGAYYSVNDPSEDSYGVSADYVDGPIAVNAFYDFTGGAEDADASTTEIGIEGSYDTGANLTVLAGFIQTDVEATDETTDEYYVAGVYDLGGGAELLVSYAENEANDTDDEIGDPEYLHGTTVKVSFSF